MDDNAHHAFVQLLVEDYFKATSMHDTLRAWSKEMTKKKISMPPTDAWYRMTETLGLNAMLNDYIVSGAKNTDVVSFLTVVVAYAVHERQLVLRAKERTRVVVSSRSSRPSPMQLKLRPKSSSACARASASSLSPSLIFTTNKTNTIVKPRQEVQSVIMKVPKRKKPNKQLLSRTCSHHLSGQEVPTNAQEGHDRTRNSNNLTVRQQRHSPKSMKPLKNEDYNTASSSSPLSSGKFTERVQTIISEMKKIEPTEKQSVENWIPDSRRVSLLRRDLLQVHVTLRQQDAFEKYFQQAMRDIDGHYTENDKASVACKLCCALFPRYNLVLDIPYKAIMNIRMKWDPTLPELNPHLARPPICYDTVKICRFCAQFVQDLERVEGAGEELAYLNRHLNQTRSVPLIPNYFEDIESPEDNKKLMKN